MRNHQHPQLPSVCSTRVEHNAIQKYLSKPDIFNRSDGKSTGAGGGNEKRLSVVRLSRCQAAGGLGFGVTSLQVSAPLPSRGISPHRGKGTGSLWVVSYTRSAAFQCLD